MALTLLSFVESLILLAPFSLKYEILRGQPDKKFLLYFPYAEPKPAENWLLDIQLANAIFYDDEIGMWLSELKLDQEMRSLLLQYQAFFKKTENLNSLCLDLIPFFNASTTLTRTRNTARRIPGVTPAIKSIGTETPIALP